MSLWDSFKAAPTARVKPKAREAKKRPSIKEKYGGVGVCDLCGRRLNDRAGRPYKYAIWCYICMQHHSVYPTPCKSCDNQFHFPPGETVIT